MKGRPRARWGESFLESFLECLQYLVWRGQSPGVPFETFIGRVPSVRPFNLPPERAHSFHAPPHLLHLH